MNISRIYQFLTVLLCTTLSAQIAVADGGFEPPGQGTPGSTGGGASRPARSACLTQPDSTDALTVLAPQTYLGLTTQARPDFWVYLPSTRAATLEFSLFDRQHKGIYQTRISIAEMTGLTKIILPETIPELRLNQSYYWAVALVCNPKRRTEDWVAGGWIQRQAPNDRLQQMLDHTSDNLDRAKLYSQSQFWYDAVPALIDSSESSLLLSAWSKTIRAAGLQNITHPRFQRTAVR